MKKVIIALLALTTSATFAGNWNYQQFGNLGFYHGTDGSSYTTQQFGNLGFYHGTDANGCYHSGSWQRFGNQTFGYGD